MGTGAMTLRAAAIKSVRPIPLLFLLSPWTLKTSMSFVNRSITTRNLPSGLNANPPAPGGLGDLLKLAIVQSETNDIAAAAYIDHVRQISVLSYCIRFAAPGDHSVHQRQLRTVNTEHGNTATAGIRCEQQRMIFA